MKINKKVEGSELTIGLEGRLDTSTSPELETVIKESLDNVTALFIDMKQLDYVSSAGLRVILSAQKQMNKKGEMIIRNANDVVMEVFEVTGFVDFLTIE